MKDTLKQLGILILLFIKFPTVFSQQTAIDVADLTLKIAVGSREDIYYSFAQGDQIIFNFEEIKDKPLKDIEIAKEGGNSLFMDFKSSKIENKKIKINQKGVYRFSFNNGALSGRICKIKIQRIPASDDLANFNTNWKWETKYDTIYTPYTEDSLIGYDTTYKPILKKELIKIDTSYDKKEVRPRVHTRLNANGDKAEVEYSFPQNINTKLHTREVIAWAYFVGTDEKKPIVSNAAEKLMKPIFTINPVAGLALGVLSISTSTNGNNLNYYIIKDFNNVLAFKAENQFNYIEGADVTMASNRFEGNWQGTVYICLDNDHTYPVDVYVNFTSVSVNHYYEMKEYQEIITTPKHITLNKTKMTVNTTQIRVTVE